jgi:hypothetical protein
MAKLPTTTEGMMPDVQARLKHFGWGREGEGMTADEEAFVLGRYQALFGTDAFVELTPPSLDAIRLPPPRVAPPASLAPFCSSEVYDWEIAKTSRGKIQKKAMRERVRRDLAG